MTCRGLTTLLFANEATYAHSQRPAACCWRYSARQVGLVHCRPHSRANAREQCAFRRGTAQDAKEIARLSATATRGLRLPKPATGTTLLDQALLVAWSVFDDFVFTAEDDADAEDQAELAAGLNQPLPLYALARPLG